MLSTKNKIITVDGVEKEKGETVYYMKDFNGKCFAFEAKVYGQTMPPFFHSKEICKDACVLFNQSRIRKRKKNNL